MLLVFLDCSQFSRLLLFISTWDSSSSGLYHFEGFPPGLDTSVVIANIQNDMNLALTILLAGRRKLIRQASLGLNTVLVAGT